MCRFKSGIILKDRVRIAEGANDSHTDLLEEMGLKDDFMGASRTFVRAELVPLDGEWWVSPNEHPGSWEFIVDQDITPEWFDKTEYEKMFREAVIAWWKKHVLVDQKIDELSSGYYRLKRCEVNRLCKDVLVMLDNSTVQEMYDNSTVQEMHGDSTVQRMYNNSTVQRMHGNSTVQRMYDSSTVQRMYNNSTVQEMYSNSTVQEMHSSSTVQEMYNNSTVQEMHDNSTVQEMHGDSTVQRMYNNSTVQEMYSNSTVQEMHGSSTVQGMYNNSTVQGMYNNSTVKEMYNNSTAKSYQQYQKIKIFIPDNPDKFEMVVCKNEG